METPVVSFCFLTTQEDYCCYQLDSARLSCGRCDRTAMLLIGIALLTGGVAGAALFPNNVFNYFAWGLCMVSGFAAAAYFPLLEPALVWRRAEKEYPQIAAKLSAQTVELFETGVRLKNDRMEGFYPYEILHRCIRTEHFLLFFLGIGDSFALALRMAQPEEQERAIAVLKKNLGSRYIDRSV
jgi:hypothetical protein